MNLNKGDGPGGYGRFGLGGLHSHNSNRAAITTVYNAKRVGRKMLPYETPDLFNSTMLI